MIIVHHIIHLKTIENTLYTIQFYDVQFRYGETVMSSMKVSIPIDAIIFGLLTVLA